jgi:dTDP-4-amino-4,6-dideoxygalactose transaminase
MVSGRLEDLALFGGVPHFPEPLHIGRPNIGDRARLFDRFQAMLDRRWLSNDGPLVPQFEAEVARISGTRYCVATCNATVALELAIRALGMTGNVIVPSFTFVAPVHALKWQGLTPIFCDIDPVTHLLDPDHVERLVTEHTTGILGVHTWGQVCDVERLTDIANRHDLSLLFDAAHAFGTTHQGRAIGPVGDAQVYSFHATKVVNSFEGGAVVTNDATVDAQIRSWRNFGFSSTDQVDDVGINAKMPESSAAMGLTSLESFDVFVRVNRDNFSRYSTNLRDATGIRLRAQPSMAETTLHYVVVEIDDDAGFSRDLALRVLTAEGVLARRYFYPGCHRMNPYRVHASHDLSLPVTERVCDRVLQLPTGTAVTSADIDAVCAVLRMISEQSSALNDLIVSKRL